MMHADRTNRVLLGLFGLLLAAAGVAGLLAGTGRIGADLPNRPVLDDPATLYVSTNASWLWPVAALAGVVLVLLGGWWAATVLLSTDRIHEIRLADDPDTGRTTLAAGALGDAVDEEIEGYRGVRSAHSRLIGTPTDPTLAISVTVDSSADVGALSQRIERDALTHARQTLDRPDLPVALSIAVSRHTPARVHG